jgi:hypothetical protein
MKTATYTDKYTGKQFHICGTTVTQYSGKPVFRGAVLHLWGDKLSVADFKTPANLNSWLCMMNFEIKG